ncbi:MAG: PEP-CTERM sorting domain-containing protein [Thiogranum sp.]
MYGAGSYLPWGPSVTDISVTSQIVSSIDGPVSTLYAKLNYTSGPVAVVPVPATLWLFGSGLIGLAGMAQGRRHCPEKPACLTLIRHGNVTGQAWHHRLPLPTVSWWF